MAAFRTACVLLLLTSVSGGQALAQQSLIPSPYPSAPPGGQPLNPAPSEPGAPQTIMQDPYPQTTGPNSQGNPPTEQQGGGQRLIPSINQRKYDVDEPPH